MDHTKTDLYRHLQLRKAELLERIRGTSDNYKWRTTWQAELAAADRAMAALEGKV